MASFRASVRRCRVLMWLPVLLSACAPAVVGDAEPAPPNGATTSSSAGGATTTGDGGSVAASAGQGGADATAASTGSGADATAASTGSGGAATTTGSGFTPQTQPCTADDACESGYCSGGFCSPWATSLSIGGDVGSAHACAVTPAGGVRCWGADAFGALGDSGDVTRARPVEVQGLPAPVKLVSAGGANGDTCVVTVAGAAYCWGFGRDGELGDGTIHDSTVAAPVSGLSSGVIAIGVGSANVCALTDAGAVLCWGEGDAGQLGNGSQRGSRVPVPVTGLATGVQAIAVGEDFACALTNAGGASCWGSFQGPHWHDASVAVGVPGLASGVARIAVGSDHACAVLTTGGLVCWGGNENGQLGDGTTTQTQTPVQVSGLSSGVTAVAAGNNFTCASTASGLLCWGDGANGELGDGALVESHVPVPVVTQTSFVSFACGGVGACAITTSGGVACWGENDGAESGYPFAQISDVPVALPEE